MPPSLENSVLMLTSLIALYSPVASLPSYFPVVGRLEPAAHRRLALGLFGYVALFMMLGLWVGEPLLELLGITTAGLTVTGGVALLYEGIPLMRGRKEPPNVAVAVEAGADGTGTVEPQTLGWRSVLLMPITFPLSVGGTTFAILVSFRSRAHGVNEVLALSAAGLVHAAVTALTLYFSSRIERIISARNRDLFQRVAGVLLTTIAVTLLAHGAPRMVVQTLTGVDPHADGPPAASGRAERRESPKDAQPAR